MNPAPDAVTSKEVFLVANAHQGPGQASFVLPEGAHVGHGLTVIGQKDHHARRPGVIGTDILAVDLLGHAFVGGKGQHGVDMPLVVMGTAAQAGGMEAHRAVIGVGALQDAAEKLQRRVMPRGTRE